MKFIIYRGDSMIKKHNIKNLSGFTLIEVLIASAIILSIVVLLLVSMGSSLREVGVARESSKNAFKASDFIATKSEELQELINTKAPSAVVTASLTTALPASATDASLIVTHTAHGIPNLFGDIMVIADTPVADSPQDIYIYEIDAEYKGDNDSPTRRPTRYIRYVVDVAKAVLPTPEITSVTIAPTSSTAIKTGIDKVIHYDSSVGATSTYTVKPGDEGDLYDVIYDWYVSRNGFNIPMQYASRWELDSLSEALFPIFPSDFVVTSNRLANYTAPGVYPEEIAGRHLTIGVAPVANNGKRGPAVGASETIFVSGLTNPTDMLSNLDVSIIEPTGTPNVSGLKVMYPISSYADLRGGSYSASGSVQMGIQSVGDVYANVGAPGHRDPIGQGYTQYLSIPSGSSLTRSAVAASGITAFVVARTNDTVNENTEILTIGSSTLTFGGVKVGSSYLYENGARPENKYNNGEWNVYFFSVGATGNTVAGFNGSVLEYSPPMAVSGGAVTVSSSVNLEIAEIAIYNGNLHAESQPKFKDAFYMLCNKYGIE